MRKHLFLALGLCSVVVFTGCKSRESAYRQAYELARAQDAARIDTEQPAVAVTPATPVTDSVSVVPVTTTPVTVPVAAGNGEADVRTIPGGFTVVNGTPLKAYSVVVGSFVTQANAEGLMSTLQSHGYEARVVKTNETINNQTGWFRVIAASYDDKDSAIRMRNELAPTYAGAWLLYHK